MRALLPSRPVGLPLLLAPAWASCCPPKPLPAPQPRAPLRSAKPTVVSACDLLAVLLFLGAALAMALYMARTLRRIDRGSVVIEDYTLLVRRLPKNATEEEVGWGGISG